MPAKKGGGAAIVAVAGAIAIASAGSTGSGPDRTETPSAGTSSGEDAARRGDYTEAWRLLSLRTLSRAVKRDTRCGPLSYGEVQKFFLSKPCSSLDRLLTRIGDTSGTKIAVMVAWVTMPQEDSAQDLRALDDRNGTGNVAPLPGAPKPTGKHYRSRRSGTLVVIAEAEPLSGGPSASLLNQAAAIAVQFPPP
jgi:hypothetical protein